jgi:D-sedoheptulose 7-phosphate isomerase
LRASARRNDFVVGISTFGNSHNDIEGIRSAKLAGAYTLALTGRDGGRLKNVAD